MKNGTLKESATSIAVNQWFISHIRNEDPALAVLAWFPIGVENIEGGKCSLKCCGGSLSQYMEGAWKDFHERENILLILILYRVRWKCYFTYSLSKNKRKLQTVPSFSNVVYKWNADINGSFL